MSYTMYDMKRTTVTVRELQQNLKQVLERVERGQTIEVTRRNRPVARLAPISIARKPSPWPDLGARTRAVFGEREILPAGSDVVRDGRGDR
jgi:prevent-host-death family protein